ncbi:MAG: SipW-dependent-type signal peptide-containing protein [Propionibacteriaceae bacterium]|jgi:alternate signal-mediated exported protein|nr:SipW-dependent-type signal peptide-containing protein [Propionibacteriaceae bacterium]
MTDKSTKRRNAVIAGVAGAALLLGGSTYALWSASDSIAGGSITAGNLDIKAELSNAWDVTSDRAGEYGDQLATISTSGIAASDGTTPMTKVALDNTVIKGHAITPATWRMSPGDTVALTFPYLITLAGDNLVAALSLPGTDDLVVNSGFTAGTPSGLVFEYQLFNEKGAKLTDRQALGAAAPDVAYLQANSNGQKDGLDDAAAAVAGDPPTIPVIDLAQTANNSGVITYVLYVTFDSQSEGQGQKDVNAVLTLSDKVKATLTQVRCNPDGDTLFANGCNG